MAKTLVHRPAANKWSVLEDEDSGSESPSPVAAAVAVATSLVSAALTAAAQKKPSAARRVSFTPLPEPLRKRDEGRAVSPVRLVPVRGSARPTVAEMDPDFGAPLTNEWADRGDMDAVVEEMKSGSALWGDLEFPPGCVMPEPIGAVVVHRRRENTQADFWDQPWAEKVEEVGAGDIYDTRELSDEDWEAAMGWVFWAGWYVRDWCREFIHADEDNGPSSVWIPPSVLAEDAAQVRRGYRKPAAKKSACCGSHAHVEAQAQTAPKPKKEKVAAAPIPRFCRAAGACADEGCRYTHGDTIPVQNKPCAFDGRCSGEKRATCVYLHPSEGEVWTAALVRHRPAVAATE
jgi:hypothetical protein